MAGRVRERANVGSVPIYKEFGKLQKLFNFQNPIVRPQCLHPEVPR
jgi:hypothetical protein